MNRNAALSLALAAFAGLACGRAAAEDTRQWTLGGSVLHRSYSAFAQTDSLDARDFSYGSASVLALDFRATGERARAEASIEASVLGGAAARATWLAAAPAGSGSGAWTVDTLLAPSPKSAADAASPPAALFAARLRSLYVKLDLDWASLIAGRQVINYGRGALWSPVDLFADPDYSGLSMVRRGVDTLRLTVPSGATGAFDLVAAPKAIPAEGRYALRFSGMMLDIDFGLLAARDGARGLWAGGADFKLDLGPGFYGEAIAEFADSSGALVYRAAAGADWSSGNLVFAVEYYLNAGKSDSSFPGRDNVFLTLSWLASDFLVLSESLIWEAGSSRIRETTTLSWDAAQNAAANLYVRAGGPVPGGGNWSADAGFSIEVKF